MLLVCAAATNSSAAPVKALTWGSVDKACTITPGLESPTISPLQKADWVAVRAMVPRQDTNVVMDDLWTIGARGILVTDIHACRL